MKRRLFTILSTLSLLLFLAVVVMWVRSYWWWEGVSYERGRRHWDLASAGGDIIAIAIRYENRSLQPLWRAFSTRAAESYEGQDEHPLRVRWRAETDSYFGIHYSSWRLTLPYTYASAATCAVPAAWLIGYARRRRRPRAGHCASCGYDLRATPERCPECGEPVA